MDQTPLVAEEIADGKRFLDRLAEEGFPVTVAGWLRESDNGRWYLYIASPVVDHQGIRNAYGRINDLLHQMPQPFLVSHFGIRAVGTYRPIVAAMLDLQRRNPGRSFFHIGGSFLGDREIDDAYLYPPVAVAQPR
jgi:hypothetical protein